MDSAILRPETEAADSEPSPDQGGVQFRSPTLEDGKAVHHLIAECPPLDTNSVYCNLLQCSHFAPTCVVAEMGGEIVGWISAYRPPEEPDTIFVWQVACHSKARGQGLGGRMLAELIARPACKGVVRMKTTVTPDNAASRAMFAKFAKRAGADLSCDAWILSGRHLPADHESEELITIGPLNESGLSS